MPGVFVILPFNHVNGTVADANEVNANNAAMRDGHNLSLHGTTGHIHDGNNWNGPKLTGVAFDIGIFPIGSIVGHYDFNGGLAIDTNYFAYCDGSVKTVTGLGAVTLPDLSNRYLVGFGTEGGGDVDTAAWATAAVGNASHQIDIQHNHTVSHNHAPGSLLFKTLKYDSTPSGNMSLYGYDNSNNLQFIAELDMSAGAGVGDTLKFPGAPGGAGNPPAEDLEFFTAAGTGTTATTVPTSSNSLSTTQSIQPRSIRVRWIMRTK